MNINIKFFKYVAIVSFVSAFAFTSANYVHIPVHGIKDIILNILHFFVVTAAIFVLYYCLSINRFVFSVGFPIVIYASALVSYFVYFQNLTLTTSLLDAAFDNDWRTSGQLITFPLIIFFIGTSLFLIIVVFTRLKFVRYRFSVKESLWVLIIGAATISINYYRNNTIMQRIPFNIYFTAKQYFYQQNVVDEVRKDIGKDASSYADSITVVLIIGEACRADHLQLNGYHRRTNPHLSLRNVISYPDIYSEWTHTNSSLPHFLTRSDSANHTPALVETSFITVFNRAGFFTMWIANQEPAASYISFVKEAKRLRYVNPANSVYAFNKKWLDTDNLKFIQTGLKEDNPRKLIVVHTIGSHWWYNDHFTDSFEVFKPITDSKIVSNSRRAEIINSYDNTIVFTDYFLDKVVGLLENENACMVYLSDHGESLGENDKWLHAQDNGPEHYPACLIWCSEKYKANYPEIWQNLMENRLKRWRTDFLFPSIISLGTINTTIKNRRLDVTQPGDGEEAK